VPDRHNPIVLVDHLAAFPQGCCNGRAGRASGSGSRTRSARGGGRRQDEDTDRNGAWRRPKAGPGHRQEWCAAAAEGRTRTQTGTACSGSRRQDENTDRNSARRRLKAGRGQEKRVVGGQDASIREQGQTSCHVRKEREEEKKERSGRRLLLRISITHLASLHIPSSHSASLHIPSSRIPDGAKGHGLAGTRRDSSPSLDPSSHEGSPYRCRPLWVASVVNVHCFHLNKVFFGFPCWVRKPSPLNQILQPSSRPPIVQNLFNLPLFFALKDYR